MENGVAVDVPENGFNDRSSSVGPEQDGGKERAKKKTTYSRKNKQMKVLGVCPGRNSGREALQEWNGPQRSDSREPLSESSAQSLSGHGYSCDSESDIDDKASDVGSEKLFSPTAQKGVTTNESLDPRTYSSAKVSGLQRSQEQSSDTPYGPTLPGSPAPTVVSAPPPPAVRAGSPVPLPVKKEPVPPGPAPPPPKVQPQPLPELRAPPPQRHTPPLASHTGRPLSQYSLHALSRGGGSVSGVGLPRQHPPTPHLSGLVPPAPPLPLSIADLSSSHYSLRAAAHRHPAMFATPATLPPPPTLPANGLGLPGHPAGAAYPEHDLLRQELNNRFLVQSSERGRGPSASPLAPVSLLRAEFHQHQHMHQHQHTHQHTFTPYPASLPPAAVIAPPTAPPMVRTPARNFDKYTPKLDNPFLRHSTFFPSYPPTMPGVAPLLPHSGPFSSLQGAFQPKASNPIDVAARPGAVPHTLLQKDPRVTDPFRTPVRKPGKWCAVHVQIAWQIYHHQQKMKQMQMDSHKMELNGKLDLFSRPPGPGVFPGFPYPHDLARPLFSSTGSAHPAASPYGPSPHHSGFLPTSHLPGKWSNSMFGHKEGTGLPGFSSPHHDTWNRLHRTPPSFPTPPQWPKAGDVERGTGSAHDRERERERDRERDKRDSSVGKEERDKDRDSLERNRHSNRSSPATAPVSYQISSLIRGSSQSSGEVVRHAVAEREKEGVERQRDAVVPPDVKVKESRSPGREVQERRAPDDPCRPVRRSPSPYLKATPTEPVAKGPGALSREMERKETPAGDTGPLRVRNDMKIKEERKEEQEVLVVGSEPATQPPTAPLPPPLGPHHHPAHPSLVQQQPLPPQVPSRCAELPAAAALHGVALPHSLPLPVSAMHQMGGLGMLDRSRVAPFVGVSPLAGTRERLPHPAFPWDPLAYRSLDLQRRVDLQLRAEAGPRFGPYDTERPYRDREPLDYAHHELLEVRREHERLRQAEERERMHLREELDRARLHQLHQSPMEGHLPHMPPFVSHLGSLHYPRLSPSTGHAGLLNRTPPTAALSAPPPLVPAGTGRPSSPRRTTPLTSQDPRDYSPTRNPKEVEAR
ncbi:autism susceptibility gene 2 protein-like isoform X2 [Brienomyrus brachyistius]|uniref:autism susceptibility gene 2 protein-like isoform X2 n=1 Tax=Brienomyrus brachyistius TaxID=42636 RepID=UPI0020B1FA58|nr:autism susceptibility gene 2 protein-like isoform X2 [Brienomyrus brachyistius]